MSGDVEIIGYRKVISVLMLVLDSQNDCLGRVSTRESGVRLEGKSAGSLLSTTGLLVEIEGSISAVHVVGDTKGEKVAGSR
jgi:hypothetical protein